MDFNLAKARIEGPQHGTFLETIDWRLNRHKELGVNCVRISMNQSWWVNGGAYVTPEQYQAQLDRIVETCQALDIYVYFCLHLGSSGADDMMAALMADHNYKHSSWSYGWLDFTKLLTDRYKDSPAFVGLQIWAEPAWGHETDINILNEKWASFMQDNIDAIHSVNLDTLVFVTSPGYYTYKWVSHYYVDNPLIGSNIVYAWQDYYMHQSKIIDLYNAGDYEAARSYLEDWFEQKAFKMTSAPTMLAEMGFSLTRPTQNWGIELHAIKDWYAIQRLRQQGWTQWVWGYPGQDLGLTEDDWTTLNVIGDVMVQNLAGKTSSHLLTINTKDVVGVPFTIKGV